MRGLASIDKFGQVWDCYEEANIRAASMGVQISWTQNDTAKELEIQTEVNDHPIRIICEAITSCFHQASCDSISIDIIINEDQLRFELVNPVPSDNSSHTISNSLASKYGNGLGNIHYRAAEIGATVNWGKRGNEMIFYLHVPLS
jgi:signal transduction histidine kinase